MFYVKDDIFIDFPIFNQPTSRNHSYIIKKKKKKNLTLYNERS